MIKFKDGTVWTLFSHPTKESLIKDLKNAENNLRDFKIKLYELPTISQRYKYSEDQHHYELLVDDAKARVELWDSEYGMRSPISKEDDTKLLEEAKKKQEWLDKNITPMPTKGAVLASIKNSIPEYVRKIMNIENLTSQESPHAVSYRIDDVSLTFDRKPECYAAMDQLRKFNNGQNIMEYGEGYIPCQYLTVTYKKNQLDQAIELLSKDLQILGNFDCIVGNLSLPKIIHLGISKDSDFENCALYVWPFVDLQKLAQSIGKDLSEDFNYDGTELLKAAGIKTVTDEGSLGLNVMAS